MGGPSPTFCPSLRVAWGGGEGSDRCYSVKVDFSIFYSAKHSKSSKSFCLQLSLAELIVPLEIHVVILYSSRFQQGNNKSKAVQNYQPSESRISRLYRPQSLYRYRVFVSAIVFDDFLREIEAPDPAVMECLLVIDNIFSGGVAGFRA